MPPYRALTAAPESTTPHKRLRTEGASLLTSAELLAILLGSGSAGESALLLAERILSAEGGLHGLAQASAADLELIGGLSGAKVARITAALELSKRLLIGGGDEHIKIVTAADAARYVGDMAYLRQEHVRAILLDSRRQVIDAPTIYIGTLHTTALRIAEIYREAIVRSSAALILVHNHPSGDPSPSPEDVEVTRSLAAAGRLLDVALIDHIIIGHQRWVSLRDLGFTF